MTMKNAKQLLIATVLAAACVVQIARLEQNVDAGNKEIAAVELPQLIQCYALGEATKQFSIINGAYSHEEQFFEQYEDLEQDLGTFTSTEQSKINAMLAVNKELPNQVQLIADVDYKNSLDRSKLDDLYHNEYNCFYRFPYFPMLYTDFIGTDRDVIRLMNAAIDYEKNYKPR